MEDEGLAYADFRAEIESDPGDNSGKTFNAANLNTG